MQPDRKVRTKREDPMIAVGGYKPITTRPLAPVLIDFWELEAGLGTLAFLAG